jgi:hypothetical protein
MRWRKSFSWEKGPGQGSWFGERGEEGEEREIDGQFILSMVVPLRQQQQTVVRKIEKTDNIIKYNKMRRLFCARVSPLLKPFGDEKDFSPTMLSQCDPGPLDRDTFLALPPPPNCISSSLDFSRGALPEYADSFALLIHHLLSSEECQQLLSLAESTTVPPGKWAPAEINVGNGRQRMVLEARNCGRIIWDSFPIAKRLMVRIMPHLPAEIVRLSDKAHITGYGPVRRREVWRISRLNERLRFLKYTSGMYFREHYDGSYVTPDGKEISFLTVHVYLNGDSSCRDIDTSSEVAASGTEDIDIPDSGSGSVSRPDTDDPAAVDNGPVRGGATRFFSMHHGGKFMDVKPEMGTCLVFQHRGLLHSGEEVEAGVKYTIRSDVIYQKVEEVEEVQQG